MEKRKAASVLGGILAFIGLTGRRDDFFATVEKIDILDLPVWADWSFIVIGGVSLLYGIWPRSEAARAMDREWTEEGAIETLNLRLKHHRELFPNYLGSLAIVLSFIFLVVAVTTCDGPYHRDNSGRQLYLNCLKENTGSAEACEPVLRLEERR